MRSGNEGGQGGRERWETLEERAREAWQTVGEAEASSAVLCAGGELQRGAGDVGEIGKGRKLGGGRSLRVGGVGDKHKDPQMGDGEGGDG